MPLNLSSIQVITANKNAYLRFICEVLDAEVIFDQASEVKFLLSGVEFHLIEMRGFKPVYSLSAFFEFDFDCESELQALKQRYEFYCYKHGLTYDKKLIIDPDSRVLAFTHNQ
jgi:hypothetical protein